MSDRRDERINDRLDEISGFVKHSEKKNAKTAVSAQEAQKNDILNELPAEFRFKALQNGMSLDELRELYAEVKSEYLANKVEFEGGRTGQNNNQRRQDNVRERFLEEEKERQNEQARTMRRRREYQRQYPRV